MHSASIICLSLLLLLTTPKQVEQFVLPAILSSPQIHDSNYTFKLGDHITIEYSGRYGQLDGVVLERIEPMEGNLVREYKEHPEGFRETGVCAMRMAGFEVGVGGGREGVVGEGRAIGKYAVGEEEAVLYLLDDENRLYVVGYDKKDMVFDNETKELGVIEGANNKSQMFFHPKSSTLYITTEKDLWIITNAENKVNLQPVQGYTQASQPIKYKLQGDLIVFIHQDSVSIYKIVQPNIFQLSSKITTFQAKPLWVSDVYIRGRRLWVLDQIQGIYYYQFDDRTFRERQVYSIPYGRKLAMAVQANTFQVTFQYNKFTYIAEMFLQSQQLHLNRFYDRIQGINQVVMMDQLLFVLGEIESMCVWHSVNQQYLLSKKTLNSRFVSSIGIMSVTPLQSKKNETKTLLAVSHKDLRFYNIIRTTPKIQCDLRHNRQRDANLLVGRHSLVIQINTTSCHLGIQQSNLNSLCQTIHNFNINILGDSSSRQQKVLWSIGFLLSLSFFFLLILCFCKYQRRKRNQLNQMRVLLNDKIQEWQKYEQIKGRAANPIGSVASAGQSLQD